MTMNETLSPMELGHKLTLSVVEAAALSGLAKALIESALKDGSLKQVKKGKATAIKRQDLEAWVAGLETTTAEPYTRPAELSETL